MKNKAICKRLMSGILTASMLCTASITGLPLNLTASAAYEMLGQTDFDDGVGLPWHTCVTLPAHLEFDIKGGTYNVHIIEKGGEAVGGESRWDCQFRHRKLKFSAGNSYTVKAEVTSDTDGEIYTCIGDLSGDIELWHNGYGKNDPEYGQNWNCMKMTAGETLKIDSTWTCQQGVDVAQWAWYFGGAGDYQENDCFPNGTTLKFDNLSCVNNTDDTGGSGWISWPPYDVPSYSVSVNQVGYYMELEKKATLHSDQKQKNSQVYLVDAGSKEVVWSGAPKAMSEIDPDSGMYCSIIDFTEFRMPGTYYFSTDGSTQDSYEFTIGSDIYGQVVKDALNYFYQNRCGVHIEERYIASAGENSSKVYLAHPGSHNPDTAAIQTKWVKMYQYDGSDVEKDAGTLTANGGWYESGNHEKSVVNGGSSVWMLQNLYEWTQNDANDSSADKFCDASGSVIVPESGNSYPDLLDEARYELEWFFDMMADADYQMFASDITDTGHYENMVFHKMCDHKWTGLAIKCWDYADEWGALRIVRPPSVTATLNVAACAAQAARLWQDYDPEFAALCLKNAKLTYEAAKNNPKLFAPSDVVGTGAYGDNHAEDDFYWAACELYITTGDQNYLADLESFSSAYDLSTKINGGDNLDTFTSFNWGSTAAQGTLSLYLNPDAAGANISKVTAAITKAADVYVKQEGEQGFGIPYAPAIYEEFTSIGGDVSVPVYEFGSNAMVVNNTIIMAYAYSATGDQTYLNGVAEGLNYLFGRNPFHFSYVTGYGTFYCVNPHHRWWTHEVDSDFPYAPPGVLASGPNSGLQDEFVRGAGLTRYDHIPPQQCYYDSVEAWSVNDVSLQWNAAFAWIMSFIEDETMSAAPQYLYGDVDCNGKLSIADVVLLSRYVNEDQVTISDTGLALADVRKDGTIDSNDITMMLKCIARLIDFSVLGK